MISRQTGNLSTNRSSANPRKQAGQGSYDGYDRRPEDDPLPLWKRASVSWRIAKGQVSWIHRHLDTSSASLNPVSERRSEFRYTVALPRGAQLVNTTTVRRGRDGKKHKGRRQGAGKTRGITGERARDGGGGSCERASVLARGGNRAGASERGGERESTRARTAGCEETARRLRPRAAAPAIR